MPRPTGPQWDAFGAEPVKLRALMTINKAADAAGPDWRSGVIKGQQAKDVMRAANIRQWPLVEHATSQREGWTESEDVVYPHETLHTTQDYLHAPTLRKYMEEGPPEHDPEYGDEERPYLPEIVRTERGTPWIDEGHHRLVASRLGGEYSTRVMSGPLKKY